jgi:hypothetical protein
MGISRSNIGSLRTTLLLAVLTACIALPIQKAGATIFNDPIHTLQNVLTQILSLSENMAIHGTEYAEQAKRWAETYKQMQRQLIKLQSFTTADSLLADSSMEPLVKRDIREGLAEACPGANASFIDNVWGLVKPDPNTEIREQQTKVCTQIVMLQNKRFNATIDVTKSLEQRARDWKGIDAFRVGSGESEGQLQGAMSEIDSFTAAMAQDLNRWEVMDRVYDTQIESLHQKQEGLAMMAMRGKEDQNPLIGIARTVVQGSALKAALNSR